MHLIRPRIAMACAAFAIAATRQASAQAPKPVPGQPYQYWDVLEADGAARKVYFRNDTPNPITITELVINRCENTRQKCGTYPAKLVVEPGKTATAFRVEQYDKKLGWSFAYSFHTQLPPQQVVGPPSGAGIVRDANGVTMPLQTVPIDSLRPSVPAYAENGACGKMSVPDLPPTHGALLMIFGTAQQPTARRLMVRVDGSNAPYDITDLRRDTTSTTTEPRQTQINIDVIRQTVFVHNSGGGETPAFYRATGSTALTSIALGSLGESIARMVKECQ